MKYFVRSKDYNPHPLPNLRPRVRYEATEDFARGIYKMAAVNCGLEHFEETAKRTFKNGATAHDNYVIVWGEDVTDEECFRLRLAGKLSNDIASGY